MPVAVEALTPETVAESVTGVLGGTEIEVPDWPPPDSEVETLSTVKLVAFSASSSEK